MVAPLPSEVMNTYVEKAMLVRLPVRLELRLGAAGIVTRGGVELSPAAIALFDELRAVASKLYPRQDRR